MQLRNRQRSRFLTLWPKLKMQCTLMTATWWHLSISTINPIASTLIYSHSLNTLIKKLANSSAKMEMKLPMSWVRTNIKLYMKKFIRWVHLIEKISLISKKILRVYLSSSIQINKNGFKEWKRISSSKAACRVWHQRGEEWQRLSHFVDKKRLRKLRR